MITNVTRSHATIFLCAGSVAVLLSVRSTQAQSLTWNAGSNTWDNGITQDWNGGAAVWTDAHLAEFEAPAAITTQTMPQTVTVAGTLNPTGLQFDANAGAFSFVPAATGTNLINITGGGAGTGSGGYKRNLGTAVDFSTGVLASFAVAPTVAGGDSISAGATTADDILIGATINHTNFVAGDKTGSLTAATYVVTGTTTVTAGKNVDVTGSVTATANTTINSLRFNTGNFTLTNPTGTLTISSGMILDTGNTFAANPTVVTGGTLASGTGELLLDCENANTTAGLQLSVSIGGTTSITKTGVGNVTLQGPGAISYTGATNVLQGMFQIGSNNTSDTYTGTGAFNLSAGATLAFRVPGTNMGNNTTTVPGLISGAGGVTINNPNTSAVLILSDTTNSYTGVTTINANSTSTGILSVATLANIGTVSNIGTGIATNAATNAASLTFTGAGAPILLYTGAAVSTNRLFTINGSVSPTLYANGSGALTFSNPNAIAFSLPSGTTAFSNNTLTFSGTSTAGTNTFDPIIGNSSASTATTVIKAGTSTWALGGANTYTGATTITGGNLSVSSINTVAAATGSTGVTSAHLTSSSLGAPATAALGIISLGGSFTNFPTGGNVSNTNATLTYTGVGETTDRVINLASTNATADVQTIDQSGTGNLEFTSAFTATGAGTHVLTLQGSTAGTGEIAGAIPNNSTTNTTSLTKAGTGTWTLDGSNTFTGATAITGGTLVANGASALGTTSGITVGNGATLSLTANNALGTGAAAVAAGSTTTIAGTVPVTLTGGTLIRNGAGVSQGNGASSTVGMGLLTLTAGTSSTLDFGTTGSGTLSFSAFLPGTSNNAVLNVLDDNNTSGLAGVDGSTDRLIFNQNLTTAQLGDLYFSGVPSTSAQEIALGNGEYEILPVNAIPVPEPSAYLAGGLGFLCAAYGWRSARHSRSRATV